MDCVITFSGGSKKVTEEPLPFAFNSILHALGYYHVSPVGIRAQNYMEPDAKRGSSLRDGVASEDKHAIVHLCVRNALKRGNPPFDHKLAFALRHLLPRDQQQHYDDIAHGLGRSPSSVRRWVAEIEYEFGEELVRFGVLDPEYMKEMRPRGR